MSMHVSSVCRAAFSFLCQLRQVMRSVSVDAAKTSSHHVSSLLQPLFYTTFPTSCSGAYRPYRMLQHAWSLAPEGVTTSPRSCSNYTGYQYDSEWNLSSLSCAQQPGATTSVRWLPARCYHRAGAVSFNHQFQVHNHAVAPVHVLKIKHPMLPDHAFGTLFLHAGWLDLSFDTFRHKLKSWKRILFDAPAAFRRHRSIIRYLSKKICEF